MEPRTIAIRIEEDNKPADKVPEQLNRVNINLNE